MVSTGTPGQDAVKKSPEDRGGGATRKDKRIMEAREIIEFIGNAEKKTPVKVYVKEKEPVDFAGCQVFGNGDKIVFGDWGVVQPILAENADKI